MARMTQVSSKSTMGCRATHADRGHARRQVWLPDRHRHLPPILLILLVVCGIKGKWGTVIALVIVSAVFAIGTGWDAVTIIGWTLVGSAIAAVPATRWAKPGSYWARQRYDVEKLEKAQAYHESDKDKD